ncbi:MAG: 30S ribosomal protein S27ae [Candidatus Aenigmarchaeota archaeon]|nr:30S ribosomal protein S27ae [Candidatus Aenigmarchaeota archaeon]
MPKHKPMQHWKMYKDGKHKSRACARCGAGTWMAEHKDRFTCGKCKYSESKKTS